MFDADMFLFLIPLAPFMLGGLAIWTRHRHKMLEMELELARLQADRPAPSNDRLEQRVRNLERILTDGRDDRDDLARQIEDLRRTPVS